MRHPVNSLVDDLRETATASREAAAVVLYGLVALRARMLDAAKAGHEVVTIPGPDGIDLRETPAAVAAVAWLDGQKITNRWDSRTGAAGVDAAGSFDLVLSWKTPAASR